MFLIVARNTQCSRLLTVVAIKFWMCQNNGKCKTNTIPILMHQMRISTNQVSLVMLVEKVGNHKNIKTERANKNQK
jgi:hypothetical protein